MIKESPSSDPPSCTAPEGASCWLCLEEGPDDSGAPLVRDCSCRGHSGYAHLPCLIKYAESKSREFAERGICSTNDDKIFKEKFFRRCPNCKQEFWGDVYYEMAKAQLSFIEREFKEVPSWHLYALVERTLVLDGTNEADIIEGEKISAKMLTLIEVLKENNFPSSSLCKRRFLVHQLIGNFNFKVGTPQSLGKAKTYYEIAKNIGVGSGARWAQSHIRALDEKLASVEAKLKGGSDSLPKKRAFDLKALRAEYGEMIQRRGEHAILTIRSGNNLAEALLSMFHTIEALRLLERIVQISSRVHGSDHRDTKMVNLLWQSFKPQYVYFEQQLYYALRYENDGKNIVVQGPIPEDTEVLTEPKNFGDEKTFAVPNGDVYFSLGSIVMLHGLKKGAHLNGEIGDIRNHCQLSGRWVVHLEGNTSKPVKVKQENLRIVFDLPDQKKRSVASQLRLNFCLLHITSSK